MAVSGSSTDRQNNFDLLRLLAASQVMIEHTFGYLDLPRFTGWPILAAIEGVPIFFVISGFLISASWRRSGSALDYALRRAARIFPGLWCCLIATVLVALAFGFAIPPAKALIWFVMQCFGIIYTPGFLSPFGVGAYNTSLWTIPIELQFYLVLPILYAVFLLVRRPRAGMVVAFGIFLAIALVLYSVWLPPLGYPETGLQKLARYSFVPHFYMFLAGVVIREFNLHRHRVIAGAAPAWILLYAAFLFVVPHDPLKHAVAAIIGRMILSVTVISAAYTLPALAQRVIGSVDISYGIYIYHGLLINALLQLHFAHRIEGLYLVLACTPLLATASWFGIEKPVLKLVHHIRKPRLHALAAATSPMRGEGDVSVR